MPSFATEDDRLISSVIDRWKDDTRESLCDIEGWRRSAEKRLTWPSMPNGYYTDMSILCNRMRLDYPHIDPTPLEALYRHFASWYGTHSATQIPAQPKIEALADIAVSRVNALELDIMRRLVRPQPDNACAEDTASEVAETTASRPLSFAFSLESENLHIEALLNDGTKKSFTLPMNGTQGTMTKQMSLLWHILNSASKKPYPRQFVYRDLLRVCYEEEVKSKTLQDEGKAKNRLRALVNALQETFAKRGVGRFLSVTQNKNITHSTVTLEVQRVEER